MFAWMLSICWKPWLSILSLYYIIYSLGYLHGKEPTYSIGDVWNICMHVFKAFEIKGTRNIMIPNTEWICWWLRSCFVTYSSLWFSQEPILEASHFGDTGQCPDDPWAWLQALERENDMLKQEREALEMELRNLKIAQDSGDTPHIQEGQQANDMDEPLSEEAARKRLERICKKNTQGHLGLYRHTLQLKPVACLSAAIHPKKVCGTVCHPNTFWLDYVFQNNFTRYIYVTCGMNQNGT